MFWYQIPSPLPYCSIHMRIVSHDIGKLGKMARVDVPYACSAQFKQPCHILHVKKHTTKWRSQQKSNWTVAKNKRTSKLLHQITSLWSNLNCIWPYLMLNSFNFVGKQIHTLLIKFQFGFNEMTVIAVCLCQCCQLLLCIQPTAGCRHWCRCYWRYYKDFCTNVWLLWLWGKIFEASNLIALNNLF